MLSGRREKGATRLALKSLKSVLSNTIASNAPSERNSGAFASNKTFIAIDGIGTPDEEIIQKISNDASVLYGGPA